MPGVCWRAVLAVNGRYHVYQAVDPRPGPLARMMPERVTAEPVGDATGAVSRGRGGPWATDGVFAPSSPHPPQPVAT